MFDWTIDVTEAKLAVLDGAVHVDEANGAVDISKKKTATFEIFDQSEPTIARNVETTPFDGWDHEASLVSLERSFVKRIQFALCVRPSAICRTTGVS